VKDATERASRAWRKATRPTPIPRNLSTQCLFPASHQISSIFSHHTRTDIRVLSKVHSLFSVKHWCSAKERHESSQVKVVCFVVRARRLSAPSLSEPTVRSDAALERLDASIKSTLSSDHADASFIHSIICFSTPRNHLLSTKTREKNQTRDLCFNSQRSGTRPICRSSIHDHTSISTCVPIDMLQYCSYTILDGGESQLTGQFMV
jgi:hypothetical protein